MYQKLTIKKYTEDARPKLIKKNYKILLDPMSSVDLKLVAIDYLAQFIDTEDHRERFKWLISRERDFVVRSHMEDVLNGDYYKNMGEDIFESMNPDGFLGEAPESKAKEKSISSQPDEVSPVTVELNENFRYMRHAAINYEHD